MEKVTNISDITDSMNQPVRKSSGPAFRRYIRDEIVAKSKMELIKPKKRANYAINLMFHFFGFLRPSSSRLSVDIVRSGASERRLVNSI